VNSFGSRFRISTFGESHGKAIGCLLDGVPAGLKIDEEFIQSQLDRRRPGKSKVETARKELDRVEIISGTFNGYSTGTPIAMVIFNSNQKSRDYENIKDIFRPAHADFTYWYKYGIRDYRGGGRSSARETASRVAGGAVAQLILRELGIDVESGLYAVAGIESKKWDFKYAKENNLNALDRDIKPLQERAILDAKSSHDSVGGSVVTKISNLPIGLGEPIYYKLDATLSSAMMSINAVKAVEIGNGIDSTKIRGSQNNDEISEDGFLSNNSGGILGGISNGSDVIIKTHFKPTPSIFLEQNSVDIYNNPIKYKLEGRHDPCVAVRGVLVCEAMASLVTVDMLLLNMGSKIDYLRKIYG
jgi:chorismate synthase